MKNEDIPKFAGRIYKESQRLLQLVEDVSRFLSLMRRRLLMYGSLWMFIRFVKMHLRV